MKLNLIALGCAVLLALGLSFGTFAGNSEDADNDGVPDHFDNCVNEANGAGEGTYNQTDADGDGYGNWCDADVNQSGGVGLADFNALSNLFGCTDTDTAVECPPAFDAVFPEAIHIPVIDVNSSGSIGLADFNRLSLLWGTVAAPVSESGYACADPTLDTTLLGGPDAPCP